MFDVPEDYASTTVPKHYKVDCIFDNSGPIPTSGSFSPTMPNLKTTALEPRQIWRSCMIKRQFRLPYPQYRRIFKTASNQ
ncbi:hypothetical protein VTP01DRAFT_4455 [Rhizomucor pusillus]|uniref:uncharacterized protein n=1 Tax=Rhizomucor pusillus TaxID=4840 RepID=UPI0037447CBB